MSVPAQDHILHAGFLERVPAEPHIAAREDDQLGTLQEGAVVWAERRIDHATAADSNRIHRRLEEKLLPSQAVAKPPAVKAQFKMIARCEGLFIHKSSAAVGVAADPVPQ